MKELLLHTLIAFAFNTSIAVLLTVIDAAGGFWLNFVYSQCIGFSIYSINVYTLCRMKPAIKRWLTFSLTLPGSVILGLSLAFVITGVGGWNDPRAVQSVVIGLFFGGIGSITYFLSERIAMLDAEVKQRRLNESEIEKREIEAHLKLLQAQIEPHFLFNTLANVSSLIETDPQNAHRLLDRLTDWLRVALHRARAERSSLGDELTLLENYLHILSVRFGARLCWEIKATDPTMQLSFPPMLLQPLVENAIRHGIEPKLGGGVLSINAWQQGGRLHIAVSDDGAGLQLTNRSGAGLANVRARLAALYGTSGTLTLIDNPGGGVTARLELPA